MPIVLTDTQNIPFSAVAKNLKGNVAPVENVTWASSDPKVLTVTQDASDPMKALGSAVIPGIVVVSVKADADLTDGVVELIGTADVVVGPGQATVFEITAGTPVEQPAGSPGSSGSVIPA